MTCVFAVLASSIFLEIFKSFDEAKRTGPPKISCKLSV